MKRFIRPLAVFLAAVLLTGLTGCGVTEEDILNIVAPTDTPTPENTVVNQPTDVETPTPDAEPLITECGAFQGVFSPFWAEAEGDKAVVEMTQLSLLADNGEESPTEITRTDNSDGSVTITIELRNDLLFSDGETADADDLLFSYYVLFDPSYTGPLDLNTLPIRGLEEYQTGMSTALYEKYAAVYDETYNDGNYDEDNETGDDQTDGETEETGEETYDTEKAEEIRAAIELYWRLDEKAIVDYCMSNYGSSTEYMTGFASDAVQENRELQVMFAMVFWGYGTLNEDGELTAIGSGTTWDLESEFPTDEDFFQELYDTYAGDAEAYWNIEGIGRASMLEKARIAVITGWAELDPDWTGAVENISGIERLDSHTISVTLTYYEDSFIETLCGICLAPLHWYGDETLFDYESNSFGFPMGDLSSVLAKNGTPLGAGEYVFADYDGTTVTLTANENYWLGAPTNAQAQLVEEADADTTSS